MISLKKLIKMAKKWKNLAALRRKRILLPRGANGATSTGKGHFVVYAADGVRFAIPLDYLKNGIFQELLKTAEEEYGLQSDGPIKLPFNAIFVQYSLSLIGHIGKELEEALLMSITSRHCISTPTVILEQIHSQLLIC